ncbi:hypothetical protein BQ8794_270018 [Mesorhizobium prunaredense]|uniref:Uncharacterized protein n=1 Tax=Mesorhizobium prunaredense TaxID=1631249 RepID=A0A1R3VBN5_9HYPH|nr:hypothetical protein BQ8794_270018 [Mesorhizobium prunaredense]
MALASIFRDFQHRSDPEVELAWLPYCSHPQLPESLMAVAIGEQFLRLRLLESHPALVS